MYINRRYVAGETIEIHKTYSKQKAKNMTRAGPINATPEAVKNYNYKMACRVAARTLNENFVKGKDVHCVFEYFKGSSPDVNTAKAQIKKAIADLRSLCSKAGVDFKWMKSTAVGKRGKIHHHMVLNISDVSILYPAWPWGPIHTTVLYSHGDFSRLAAYFVGQEQTHLQKGIYIDGRWSCSRNLKRPQAQETHPRAKKWREPPKAETGYIIDVDSIDAGINPVTGMPFLFYRQRRILPANTHPGSKAAQDYKQMLQQNHIEVKQLWDAALTLKAISLVVEKTKKNGGSKKNG